MIACYLGFITQAITANFAPLLFLTFHRTYQISLGKIAFISTAFFFTQLLIDLFCAKYVDKIGYRKSVVASEILSAAGLIGLAFLPSLLPDPYVGILISVIIYAFNDEGAKVNQESKNEVKDSEVVVMDKDMFIKDVFDYQTSQEWKYKGDKPAIIDLYADWCGPCRSTAPIMKSLAKEYAGKIVIYKVNVDKEKELAALFNATSIPLFVFIPMKGEPQLFRGAADKATYKKAIDEFLLK